MITFGKYKGQSFETVLETDKNYCRFIMGELGSKTFKEFQTFLKDKDLITIQKEIPMKYSEEQALLDKTHGDNLQPSKIHLEPWLFSPYGGKSADGKWTLFFNKKLSDSNGNTQIDIAHQKLVKSYEDIFTDPEAKYNFKTSTAYINPNAKPGTPDGVIVVYCNEIHRDDILKRISEHIPGMKGKQHYWKYHSDKYAKDGVKASDYTLKLPTQ
jgi:hypothetical protein